MHYTYVSMEVMQMRGVARFFRKSYRVLAWSFPEANEKAMDLARAEGLEPQRIIYTAEVY